LKHPLDILDWSVLAAYVLILVAIGLTANRGTRKDQNEFILAGRRLSLPGFIATLVTTWYGGILGIGENTFLYGIQTWFIFGLPYYLFATIYAYWLAPKIRNSNQISIPDHFRRSFGPTAGILAAILILFIASPAPYVLSIGSFIQFSMGWNLNTAILFATFLSLLYIWFGGFRAVVRTDIFQFILMFSGFIMILIFAWKQAGSPITVFRSLPDAHLSPTGGHSYQYLLVWFFIALWTFIDPGFYQRCAAAKSAETARKGILISILFWAIFDMLTLTAGLYARVLVPDGSALFAFPALGAAVLPPLFYGLFLTGLLATIMSTIDSLGLISAVTFGRDILWQIRRSSPQLDQKSGTKLTQIGLVATALISILLALQLPSVVGLWYTIGSIIVPGLLIPFLITFTHITLKESESIWLIIFPVVLSIFWFFSKDINGMYLYGLEPFYPGFALSCIMGIYFTFKNRINHG